jgi:hypothetical protein
VPTEKGIHLPDEDYLGLGVGGLQGEQERAYLQRGDPRGSSAPRRSLR